jgi:Thioredoxin
VNFSRNSLDVAAFLLARCVGDDKAFAAVELLFAAQDRWAFVDKPLKPLIVAMRPAGLTHDQAMACLKDQSKADAMVAIGKRATDEIKMTGTPTFVIDGKVYGGELSIGQLKSDPRPDHQEVALAARHQARKRRPANAPKPMQMRVASGYQVATNSGESLGQDDA